MVKHYFKFIFIVLLTMLWMTACQKDKQTTITADRQALNRHLPKALVLTTGLQIDKAAMPKGIVIALQAMNTIGVPVRLESRDILFKPEQLYNYNIMILSTAPGYHDADRQYSLSYMSEKEMLQIKRFVELGGVLISGDNIGRNLPEGTDRITLFQTLNPQQYPLSDVYGVTLKEKNMEGYHIYGSLCSDKSEEIRPTARKNFYTLVMDTVLSNKLEVNAWWKNGRDSLPAVIKNSWGKGTSWLLASSDLLHPASEGGFLSTEKITGFYHHVVNDFQRKNNIKAQLWPWPSGYDYAFSLSLNGSGSLDEYKRLFELAESNGITPEIFVSGSASSRLKQYLTEQDLSMNSRGYQFLNYRSLNYARAVRDILENENYWQTSFSGFRFPYTMPSVWGLLAIDEKGYQYESSVGVNNLEFIHGSVVPHNLVFSGDGYYKTTDLMEVGPIYHDDYFFYQMLEDDDNISDSRLYDKSLIYGKYLNNYRNYVAKKYHGAFIYQGHPAYVGFNDTTLAPLKSLIDSVKSDNSWIAEIAEIAEFRRMLLNLNTTYAVEKGRHYLTTHLDSQQKIENLCVRLDFEAKKVEAAQGKAETYSDSTGFYIIFDATDQQQLMIEPKKKAVD